jgi:hypothetical protein
MIKIETEDKMEKDNYDCIDQITHMLSKYPGPDGDAVRKELGIHVNYNMQDDDGNLIDIDSIAIEGLTYPQYGPADDPDYFNEDWVIENPTYRNLCKVMQDLLIIWNDPDHTFFEGLTITDRVTHDGEECIFYHFFMGS